MVPLAFGQDHFGVGRVIRDVVEGELLIGFFMLFIHFLWDGSWAASDSSTAAGAHVALVYDFLLDNGRSRCDEMEDGVQRRIENNDIVGNMGSESLG